MELDKLIQAQRELNEKDLLIYNSELLKKSKNVGLSYFLLIFFGGLGLHKFYLGKIGEGIAYLIVGVIDFILLQVIIFNADRYWELSAIVYMLFGLLAIFLLYDLFTLPEQVSQQEKTLRIQLLKQFGIVIENVDKKVISVFELIWQFFQLIMQVFSENLKKIALCFLTLIIFLVTVKIVTDIQEEQAGQEAIKARKVWQARQQEEEQVRQQAEEQVRQQKIKILSEIVDNKNGTVTFKATGLTWQKCSVGQTWMEDTCSGVAKTMGWFESTKVSVNFAGHNDWRLPTKEELLTLVFCSDGKYDIDGSCKNMPDVTRPTINTTYFPHTQSNFYWSSSPNSDNSRYAWYVNFGYGFRYSDGGSGSDDKYGNYYVRLVR
jgi:uncharacterized membrane protein YuzA (DUF378 family)